MEDSESHQETFMTKCRRHLHNRDTLIGMAVPFYVGISFNAVDVSVMLFDRGCCPFPPIRSLFE